MSSLPNDVYMGLSDMTRSKIPYEDASKLYRVLPYCHLSGVISRRTVLYIIREHGSEDWTTEMFSWLNSLTSNPLVSEEEIRGELDEGTNLRHILYYYPSLLPLFRAHCHLNPTEASPYITAAIRQDFPFLLEEYTPTLAERVLLTTTPTSMYPLVYTPENKAEVDSYFFKNLLDLPDDVIPNENNLTDILSTLNRLKDCSIGKDRFQVCVQDLTHIFKRVSRAFLTKDWTIGQVLVIMEILYLHPEYEVYGKLILRHGRYARIAFDTDITRYLLNLPVGVSDVDEFLYKKLDKVLSDIIDYKRRLIEHNKNLVTRYIEDLGFPVENKIKDEVYSYVTSELIFSVKNYKLRCYTRADSSSVGGVIISCQLANINTLSPVDNDVVKSIGLDIIKLFDYYSKPDYYRESIYSI